MGRLGLGRARADGRSACRRSCSTRSSVSISGWRDGFIKSKYISLVNLLADDEVFPEYLTWRDVSDELVRWALSWLDDSEARAQATASLVKVRNLVAQPGASDRAAQHIAAWLSEHRTAGAAAGANGIRRISLSRSTRAAA